MLHAVQAQEQRRLMRQEHVIEGALLAKQVLQATKAKIEVKRRITHLASIVAKWVIHRSDVGENRTQSAINLDMKL